MGGVNLPDDIEPPEQARLVDALLEVEDAAQAAGELALHRCLGDLHLLWSVGGIGAAEEALGRAGGKLREILRDLDTTKTSPPG